MMTRKNPFQLSALLLLPLSVSFGLFPLGVTLAQTSSSSVIFQPVGAPDSTRGAASRGRCLSAQSGSQESDPPIVPLIPATDMEMTTEAYPTVFVQIPDSTPKTAEISIWDEKDQGLYQTTVPLTGTPGIVGFKLPDAAPPLAIGKHYKWSIAIICNPNQRTADVVLEGGFQRTELSSTLKQQLDTVDSVKKAQLYAQNRIWYDTLTTLAKGRLEHPENSSIADKWQQLLQSIGLKYVAQTPIVNCCQYQN